MKSLIYYPTFEPSDLSWLKYALIYLDSFSPIIPISGKSQLSYQFKILSNETNLIKPFEPKWHHGYNATNRAISEFGNILLHPSLYSNMLNVANPLNTFRNQDKWIFKIHEEKFNGAFKDYCLGNFLGKETDGGILVSKEIAYLYMTILADEISYEEKTNPITDIEGLDKLTNYLRIKDSKDLLNAFQITIDFVLPKNISQLSIEKLIKLRNDSSFSEMRKSLNTTLDNFYYSIEYNFDPSEYLMEISRTNKEFYKELGLFFGSLISLSLGAVLLINTANPSSIEFLKTLVEGTSLSVFGGYSMKKSWELNKDRRNSRKFLTKIKKL